MVIRRNSSKLWVITFWCLGKTPCQDTSSCLEGWSRGWIVRVSLEVHFAGLSENHAVDLAYSPPVSKNFLNIGVNPVLNLPKARRFLWLILWTSKATQCFLGAWAANGHYMWQHCGCHGQGLPLESPSCRRTGHIYQTAKDTDLVILQSHSRNLFWDHWTWLPRCTYMEFLRVLFKLGKTGNNLKAHQEGPVYPGRSVILLSVALI